MNVVDNELLVRFFLKQAGDAVGQELPDDIPASAIEFCEELVRCIRQQVCEEAISVAARVVEGYDRLCKGPSTCSPSSYGMVVGASEVQRQLRLLRHGNRKAESSAERDGNLTRE